MGGGAAWRFGGYGACGGAYIAAHLQLRSRQRDRATRWSLGRGWRTRQEEDDPEELPLALWSPESAEFGLLEVEPDDDLDHLLLREAALNDPREAQRNLLTEVARRLAVHEWDGLFEPTEDFVVFVAEDDDGYAAKDASVREVNPPERVAAWDDAWPPSAPREDD